MKKNLVIVLALVFVLSIAGAAFAAPNPFVDVPAKHWAYDAINTLVKNKIVDGYGDGTFRGDKTMTRYEAAQITAKALARSDKANAEVKAALDKLQVEFAAELQNLGVRVDKLEKNASSIKFTGDARIRYQNGMTIGAGAVAADGQIKNRSRFQERLRLNMTADVTENVKFVGQLRADNTSNNDPVDSSAVKSDDARNALWISRGEFIYGKGNFNAEVGRMLPTIGQFLIWNASSADGALLSWKFNKTGQFAIGYIDEGANNSSVNATTQAVNAAVAHLSVPVGPKANVVLAYHKQMNDISYLGVRGNYYKQFAYGFNTALGDTFNLAVEGIRNSGADLPDNAQKTGWFGRLRYKGIDVNKPGSFSMYVDYLKLGNAAVDSNNFAHGLNVAGGNGLLMDGAKGWGFGVQYVVAKNIDMEAVYYSLKPYDTSFSGFDSYKNSYGITTNFRF